MRNVRLRWGVGAQRVQGPAGRVSGGYGGELGNCRPVAAAYNWGGRWPPDSPELTNHVRFGPMVRIVQSIKREERTLGVISSRRRRES